jgi:hypothetical protein
MKKHLLRVFLLVLLVISLSLSCVPDRKPLAPPAIQASTPSISTLVALAATPTSDYIPTIYPLPTMASYEVNARINALNRMENYENAISELLSNEINELDPFTYANLCLQSTLNGMASAALPVCDLAVEKFPDYEEMLYARGIARSILGDYEGAISDFQLFLVGIDKNREKVYSPKTFKFTKDIYSYEDKIYGWIETLRNQENPITNEEKKHLPGFRFTNILSSDYEFNLKEEELNLLLRAKSYDAFSFGRNLIVKQYFPPGAYFADESDPEQMQNEYIAWDIILTINTYSMVCVYGCIAGDIDRVNHYCEQVDILYQSSSESISSIDEYGNFRAITIITGIYLIYLGEHEEAKKFFEDYLSWQQSSPWSDSPRYVSNSTLEKWIDKLEKKQFPFSQEDVYRLLIDFH